MDYDALNKAFLISCATVVLAVVIHKIFFKLYTYFEQV